jgi:thiol:disulfide interchange protein DsbD
MHIKSRQGPAPLSISIVMASLLILISYLLTASAHAALPLNQAQEHRLLSGGGNHATPFAMDAWHDGETVYVGFNPIREHYLYRHHFELSGEHIQNYRIPSGIGHQDEFFGDVEIFRSPVVLTAGIEGPSPNGPIQIEVRYQGCADFGVCYPPERAMITADFKPQLPMKWAAATFPSPEQQLETAVTTEPSAAASQPSTMEDFVSRLSSASIPTIVGLFLLAGLALTFTPCVLPMVPIVTAIIVGQNPTRMRALSLSIAYVIGMASAYTVMGVAMGIFGASLNLQAYMQAPWVIGTFAAVFVVLGLVMMGAINIQLPGGLSGRVAALQAKAQGFGVPGVAITGALSALVVSPCVSAPLAGTLAFISATGDPYTGGLALFSLSIGMGIPLILVGVFGAQVLPRAGAWMNAVKIAIGLLMVAIAGVLLDRILTGLPLMLMWACVCLFAAYHLGVFSGVQVSKAARVAQVAGIFPLIWAIALTVGAAAGNQSPAEPLRGLAGLGKAGTTVESDAIPSTTVRTLSEIEMAARSAQRPVMVHLTADWCTSCKVMEKRYHSANLKPLIAGEFDFVKADITENDDHAVAILNTFRAFGPPALIVFKDGQWQEDLSLYGEASEEEIKDRLGRAL